MQSVVTWALGVVQVETVTVVALPQGTGVLSESSPSSHSPQLDHSSPCPAEVTDAVAEDEVLVIDEVEELRLQSVMVEVFTTSVHVDAPLTVQHGFVV